LIFFLLSFGRGELRFLFHFSLVPNMFASSSHQFSICSLGSWCVPQVCSQ
jgi:hypothetical protein